MSYNLLEGNATTSKKPKPDVDTKRKLPQSPLKDVVAGTATLFFLK